MLINLTRRFATAFATVSPLFFGVFLALMLVSSCGKRRPPLPAAPSSTAAGSSVLALQQGNKIILRIARPTSSDRIKQINIYRLNEVVNSPLFLSEEDFAARSTVIAAVENPFEKTPREVLYTDALSSFSQSLRLRYAVRYVYGDDRQSAFSSFAVIEPTRQISTEPLSLSAAVEQNAVALKWSPPTGNLDSATTLNLLGYNVYRLTGGASGAEAVKLNRTVIKETDFADVNFNFGEEYQYFVRAVSLSASGAPLESSDSNIISVAPRDVFAPTAPQNVTVAAAPGRLSLFFAANPETDLGGYLIYRSTNAQKPLAEWEKLTAAPLKATTFQDERVESGVQYFYYVQAVDNVGNVSPPSEIAAETAP